MLYIFNIHQRRMRQIVLLYPITLLLISYYYIFYHHNNTKQCMNCMKSNEQEKILFLDQPNYILCGLVLVICFDFNLFTKTFSKGNLNNSSPRNVWFQRQIFSYVIRSFNTLLCIPCVSLCKYTIQRNFFMYRMTSFNLFDLLK